MTKPVQLSDEAYARLAAQKRPGESFSDVVLRLTGKGTLLDLAKLGRSKKELDAHERMLAEMHRLDLADARLHQRRRPR